MKKFFGVLIPGPYKPFLSADTAADEVRDALRYSKELLNTLTAITALPGHGIKLKKGFAVMLLRNLDPASDHVNGARYVLENMHTSLLYLLHANVTHKAHRLCLPRMSYFPGDDHFPVPGVTRVQFPVWSCFAITFDKAQEQSVSGRFGSDFLDMCFSNGQLYGPPSRTTHPSNVFVCSPRVESATYSEGFLEVFS